MRIGWNPWKDRAIGGSEHWHRVILPVFIPEDCGFFAESAAVLQACLDSLWRTTGEETAVSVVVNAASPRTRTVLEEAMEKGWVDEVIWQRKNIGKVEALFRTARGCHEPLITFTDCDVLFRTGWLRKMVEVFAAFPMAGAVSALPVPHLRRHATDSTWFGAVLRGCLRRGRYVDKQDIELCLRDLNSMNLISADQQERQWAVERNGVVGLIGCTHMQVTLRGDILGGAPQTRCKAAMGQDSEYFWMDLPPDLLGWWKLCLPKAYVRHMWNHLPEDVTEEWLGTANSEKVACPGQRMTFERMLPWTPRSLGGRAARKVMEHFWSPRAHEGRQARSST